MRLDSQLQPFWQRYDQSFPLRSYASANVIPYWHECNNKYKSRSVSLTNEHYILHLWRQHFKSNQGQQCLECYPRQCPILHYCDSCGSIDNGIEIFSISFYHSNCFSLWVFLQLLSIESCFYDQLSRESARLVFPPALTNSSLLFFKILINWN